MQARTFHAAALRQLHYFWPQAIGGAAPEVLPHKASVVAEAGSRLRFQLDRTTVRDLSSEVEWAKVSMLTPETYPAAARRAGRDPAGLDATAMARLFQTYEEVKAERGVIDFEDVLLVMVGILTEREDIARTIRSQYRHFVVDEYQDVNAVQQRLLDLWVGERDDVCVVGDAAQTIYSFTGASPRHLLGFSARYPQAQVVKLVRNYRSTPQIVGLANLVLRAPGQDAGVAGHPAGAGRGRAGARAHVLPRRPGRGGRCRAGDRRADRPGHPAEPDRDPLPHQRPVRGARVGPGRRRHPLPRARWGAVLRPQGGAPGGAAAARRGPR